MNFGDFGLGQTFDIKFTTRQSTGAPATLAGTPAVSAYPDNSTTQITSGITLSVDFDSVTGLNNVRVVATAGNGYAAGTNYSLVITAGTVNSVSVVGEVVGSFSISARFPASAGILGFGTAQSATDSTIVLASATSIADDLINASALFIYAGTGMGQMRVVTGWVSATDTATVSPDWAANPDSTSQYIPFALAPAATATSVMPTVLVSAGTGTGQIDLTSGIVKAKDHGGNNIALESTAQSILADTGTDGVVLKAAGLNADAVAEIAAGIFARTFDATKMSGYTFEQIVGFVAAATLAKVSGMDANAPVFRNLGDTANVISATTDADGNRSAVTLTAASVA